MPPAAIHLSRLSPDLGATCQGYLKGYRRNFSEAIRNGESGMAGAQAHASALDGLLSALFCAANAAAIAQAPNEECGRIALVAVGGYGRGMVGLHSDVDVLFLCDQPEHPRVRQVAEGLLYPLWDLGIEIEHVSRGVTETLALAEQDLSTATTLIDLRRVAGDASIVRELGNEARKRIFRPRLAPFLNMLKEDHRARHERLGGSLYLLEPDVKLSRGGLRDLDALFWAARARWSINSLGDCVRKGILLSRETKAIQEAQEFLWQVRGLLHQRAGRKHDRLIFADQEEIATKLGFQDGLTLAVEQFMQSYYRHALTVAQAAERMLDRARPLGQDTRRRPSVSTPLGDGTSIFSGHVTFTNSAKLHESPELAFKVYKQVIKRQLPPYPFARDVIARAASDETFRARLQAEPSSGPLFVSLLARSQASPVRRGSLIGELHELGLTQALIPESAPLQGRVIHDVFHVYTVDIHAIVAVDRLRALSRGDHFAHLGLARRLAAELPRREGLFLAVYLHALGKTGPGNWTERGAKIAAPVLARLGQSEPDIAHTTWLIRHQTEFQRWATRRDIDDPATVKELAEQVGTLGRLRDLYLMTVCILSTTNPNAMTAWTERLLSDLYITLASEITKEGSDRSSRAASVRRHAEVRLRAAEGLSTDSLDFLSRVPTRYLLANALSSIEQHARLWEKHHQGSDSLTLESFAGPSKETRELVLICDDRAGVLSGLTAVLAAHRVPILDAQIHTAGDTIFDVITVGDKRDGLRDSLPRIRADLKDRFSGTISEKALLLRVPRPPAWSQRKSPDVPTQVALDNTMSPNFTVIDIVTKDRSGLLNTITHVIHSENLSIKRAKISTEGDRAIDVFYVTDDNGNKLTRPDHVESLRQSLLNTLKRFHDGEASADAHGAS